MVLLAAVGMIFVVALIIVNNAMVMATIDRVPEIGTLRAIGAQRGTVLGLLLAETAMLGLVAGGLGGLAAVGMVTWLGRVGVPAPADELVLLFGGPRLYPTIGPVDIAIGLVTITTVAVASTLYPATLAARVPPIVAMRGRE
jgi:ABC-type antimicrobial peptide transport system permease subunit